MCKGLWEHREESAGGGGLLASLTRGSGLGKRLVTPEAQLLGHSVLWQRIYSND